MRLFNPDTSSFNNYYDKGRFLLAWRISVAFVFIFTPLIFVYGFIDTKAMVPSSLVLLVILCSLIYLKITKKFIPIFWLYTYSSSLLANFTLYFVNELTHYVDFMWITCSVLIAFIGIGNKAGIVVITLNTIGIFVFYFFFLNDHIEILKPRDNFMLIGEFTEILFAFFVIFFLVRQFVQFQVKTQDALKDANVGLEHQYNLISAKSQENETLLKEIHHRVKNNFQIIISLLRMQSNEMITDEGKTHFKEAINRIMAMSLVHQKLYTEKELSKIDLKSYIEELVNEIITYSSNEREIKIDIETNVNGMDIISVVPLGLLINELVSNSLKHAFNENQNNCIKIKIADLENEYAFDYSDNGTWKEKKSERSNFGIELIGILTDQLNGTKSLDTTNGTKYHFLFSKTAHN